MRKFSGYREPVGRKLSGSRRTSSVEPEAVSAEEVAAVMAAARALVGLIAESIAQVDDVVTVPQLRVLVLTSMQGALNLGAVAEALGVHASNATRTVDRLVVASFLDRRDSPADRRQVELTLTSKGRDLVESVMSHRRAWARNVLSGMPASRRRVLIPALRSFVEAAGESTSDGLWPASDA